ncbi:MAG: hypothetical protein V2A79_07350 [Planctomycetota bacterium]
MTRTALLVMTVSMLGLFAGCTSMTAGAGERVGQQGAAEKFGKIYYLDGAGNWGYGTSEVPLGLKQAGYRGDVEIFIWTMTFVPVADQLNYLGARARAAALADRITRYYRQYPRNPMDVIALSAGTGVATWAIENLPSDVKINNLVLLGSSLSHDYDMTKALNRMTGKIYTYHSQHDSVLQAVRVVGTIDQKRGVDSIGLVGLKAPRGYEDRVVNTAWSERWLKLGWAGAHTDCTNQLFVRYEIAPRLLPPRPQPAGPVDEPAEPVTAAAH